MWKKMTLPPLVIIFSFNFNVKADEYVYRNSFNNNGGSLIINTDTKYITVKDHFTENYIDCSDNAYRCISGNGFNFAFPKNGQSLKWTKQGVDYAVIDVRDTKILGKVFKKLYLIHAKSGKNTYFYNYSEVYGIITISGENSANILTLVGDAGFGSTDQNLGPKNLGHPAIH